MKVDKIAIPFFQVSHCVEKTTQGGFSGVCETSTLVSVFVSFKKKKKYHNFISLIPTEAN